MSNKAIIFLEGHGEMSRDLFTSLDVSSYSSLYNNKLQVTKSEQKMSSNL